MGKQTTGAWTRAQQRVAVQRYAVHSHRLTINQILTFFGVEFDRRPIGHYRKRDFASYGCLGEHCPTLRSFWLRHEDRLLELAEALHQAYLARARQIRPDRVENHEAALLLNDMYQRGLKLFARRGIFL